MEAALLAALKAVEGLLPSVASFAPAGVQGIITFVEEVLNMGIPLAEDAYSSISNIIATLQGSGNVTADQVAALQAQSDALNAALDAAAKDDGLTT